MILIGVYSWATTLGHGYGVKEVSSFYLETKLKTTKIMVDDTFEGFVMPRKPTAH